ncbi:MAG TPA: hypothetical protein DDY13_11740 [Cytophagales bacterium]|jgi:hypothetical protein|nr:hypothetical protein [Cytophagales bacterium]
MKKMHGQFTEVEKSWHTSYDSKDHTLEVYFTEDAKNMDVKSFLKSISGVVELLNTKTLIIRDDNIESDPLGLDWKIIEATWESICKNGGNKIIVKHHDTIPPYIRRTYTDALEYYGIPINVEIKSN